LKGEFPGTVDPAGQVWPGISVDGIPVDDPSQVNIFFIESDHVIIRAGDVSKATGVLLPFFLRGLPFGRSEQIDARPCRCIELPLIEVILPHERPCYMGVPSFFLLYEDVSVRFFEWPVIDRMT